MRIRLSLLCIALALTIGCKTSSPASAAKFGWDEDLTPVPLDTSLPLPLPLPLPSPLTAVGGIKKPDKNFCRSEEPGTCFTLIFRIPSAQIINDLGLSILTLGDQSKDMGIRMQEACDAAWSDYQSRFKNDSLHLVRQALVNRITKMRCVFQTMSGEYLVEDTKLGDNEIALGVRLTKFDIQGRNRSTTVGILDLEASSTLVTTEFRSLFLYGGSNVGSNTGTWTLAKGLPIGVLTAKEQLGQNLKWTVAPEAVKAELAKVDFTTGAAQLDTASKAFFTQAKSALSTITSATSPIGPSVMLVGMGYNAYKSICGEDSARCKSELKTTNATETISGGLKDVVPTSDAVEAFRLALIRSIQGVLNKSFESLDPQQVNQIFQLN